MLAAMSKTEQRTDRNRGGITDTQVRFYQTVRKVVNIFAPRVLRAATFRGPHASRVLATPKAFRESRTRSFRQKSEADGAIHGKFVSARRSFGCAQDRLLHGRQLFARPTALAADLGAASVSYAISEWALVWVLVSHWLKPWLWQLASESQMARPWQLGSMLANQSR
jgi:hypothetical protein